MARTLTPTDVGKRVDTLNALYLNWDRRRTEFLALPKDADYETFSAAYNGMIAAQRAYEQCRDTPYRIEEAPR